MNQPPITAGPGGASSPGGATNVAEFTVSELSGILKRMVEENFEHVRVRGEISGFKGVASSGHCYFTLKDERACIDAVIWKTTVQRLRFKPEEGLEMIATGRLTTFPSRSRYQIVIDHLEPAGAGALMALLEARRVALAAEGLFDQARKRPLPYLPKVIGVVTSPTGAVIQDILHRLRDRFPTHVLVWPVKVQGEGAAEEVAAAVAGFNAIAPGGKVPRPDLLIVARGGGSVEDLWAFNEEVAVRAVAASAIPTISAVGHETDWTLIDHAADRRAPTPTGAAEMAVPVRAELAAALRDLVSRHELSGSRGLERRRNDYLALCRALPGLGQLLAVPRQKLDEAAGRLGRSLGSEVAKKRQLHAAVGGRLRGDLLRRIVAEKRDRLGALGLRLGGAHGADMRQVRRDMARLAARLDPNCLGRIVARSRSRLDQAGRLLQSYSYRGVLERGFALVKNAEGVPVRAPSMVAAGDALLIEVAAGRIDAIVAGDVGTPRRKREATAGVRPKVVKGTQADLF